MASSAEREPTPCGQQPVVKQWNNEHDDCPSEFHPTVRSGSGEPEPIGITGCEFGCRFELDAGVHPQALADIADVNPLKKLAVSITDAHQRTTTLPLPRLGSRVRIPSPAPVYLQYNHLVGPRTRGLECICTLGLDLGVDWRWLSATIDAQRRSSAA